MPHHADGLVQHERHHVAGEQIGLARVGQQAPGEVAEVIDRVRHVDGARLADGLAVVERFEQRELLGVLLDDVGDLVQNDGARGLVGIAPGLERLPRRIDGGVHVFLGGVGDGGELLAVGRAEHVERRAVGGVNPLAADVELVGLLSRVFHACILSCLRGGYPPRPNVNGRKAPCGADPTENRAAAAGACKPQRARAKAASRGHQRDDRNRTGGTAASH